MLIELKNSGQTVQRFFFGVKAFKILAEVIIDQVLLEHTHDMSLLIVHDVRRNFAIVVLLRGHILDD